MAELDHEPCWVCNGDPDVCGCKPATECTCSQDVEPHSCPFKVEIHDDYTQCECCAYCRRQCAYEV